MYIMKKDSFRLIITLHKRRAVCLLVLLIMVIITQTGCGNGKTSGQVSDPVTGENFLLDTVCTISIYEMTGDDGTPVPAADMKEQADQIIGDTFAVCARLDKTLSRTQEASEISRLNNAGGEWTEVPEDTLRLITEGRKYSELSGGDFGITVGGV